MGDLDSNISLGSSVSSKTKVFPSSTSSTFDEIFTQRCYATSTNLVLVNDAVVRELTIRYGEQRRVPRGQRRCGLGGGIVVCRSATQRKSDGRHLVIARARCRSRAAPGQTLVQVRQSNHDVRREALQPGNGHRPQGGHTGANDEGRAESRELPAVPVGLHHGHGSRNRQ